MVSIRYQTPEYKNQLYMISSISTRGARLLETIDLPRSLACDDVYDGFEEDAKIWMSSMMHACCS